MVMAALAAIPALAQQPSVKTDTTVTVEYHAGKNRVETAGFKSNWFIGVDGGAQVYFGEFDSECKFGDRLAPALNIYVGKWFTPLWVPGWVIAASDREVRQRHSIRITPRAKVSRARTDGAQTLSSRSLISSIFTEMFCSTFRI